jgi:hypothetical protein
MPAPTNISSATATNVGSSFPYTTTQDVNDAGTTYTVWYKIILGSDKVISVFGFGDLIAYTVLTTVYLSDGTTVFNGYNYTQNLPLQLSLAAGTYYFKFSSVAGNVGTAVLSLRVDEGPNIAIVLGDLLVNQDIDNFSLITIRPSTEEVVNVYPAFFPAGESGGSLPTSLTYIFHDFVNSEIVIFDVDFNEVVRIADATYGDVVAYNPTGDVFYSLLIGVSFYSLFQWAPDGTPTTLENNTIPKQASFTISQFTVNSDATRLYIAGNFAGASKPIKVWNLTTHAYEADLAPADPDFDDIWDVLCLADDTILALYYHTPPDSEAEVRQYNAAGTLLRTYPVTDVNYPAGTPPRITIGPDDPDSFWIMYALFLTQGITKFIRFDTSDGSEISNFNAAEFEAGVYRDEEDVTATPSAYFGPSFSCPLVLGVSAPEALGSITVNKVLVGGLGSETFDFTAGGGLSPASFTLGDTDSQVFSNLAPGTYSIQETPVTGFTISYTVTGDQDPAAIEILGGENITVTVTNTETAIPNPLSGIYKIVPDKRNDTLWVSFDPEETEDVKIPDPFFKTGLIGK